MAWNRTVLGLAADRIDYLAVHHYYGRREMDGDLRNLMARPLVYERWYGEFESAMDAVAPGRRPRLAINEWGLDVPESQQYSIVAALYAARLMNVFQRRSDVIAMTAVSDLVNGWPGGIIQASRDDVFITPIYLVNRLYAAHGGTERLETAVRGPTFSSTHEGHDVPVLDVVATRSANRRAIVLHAVNTDLEHPLTVRVTIRSARVSPTATVERVVAGSLDAVNGFGTPDAVHVTRGRMSAGSTFPLQMPAHSIAVVTLEVAP
jgi:alpha-L-arabinofuranosidase